MTGTLDPESVTMKLRRFLGYALGGLLGLFVIATAGLGLGITAARTTKPAQVRLKSLVTHAVFGVGLYVCALGVSYVLRVHA